MMLVAGGFPMRRIASAACRRTPCVSAPNPRLAAAVILLAYCLWAFERANLHDGTLSKLSIIPVTFGPLRYQLLLERGQGGAPEEAVLGDKPLLFTCLAWVLTFTLGIYVK
jgi:decaprenyl-phosphate phosphoribosyltransferase